MEGGLGVGVGTGVAVSVGLAVGLAMITVGLSVGEVTIMGTVLDGIFRVGRVVGETAGTWGAGVIVSCRTKSRISPDGGTVADIAVGMNRDGC